VEIPAELMVSADRQERITELEAKLKREWISFVVIDNLGILVPSVVLFVLLVNRGASDAALAALAIAGGLLMGGFVLYWMRYRTLPLQREIAELKRLEGGPAE
jgi:hypothetical protein